MNTQLAKERKILDVIDSYVQNLSSRRTIMTEIDKWLMSVNDLEELIVSPEDLEVR